MLTIRPATLHDAPGIAATHMRAWQIAYRDILPQGYLATLDLAQRTEQRRSWLMAAAGRPDSTTLVVEKGGQIVGHVSVGPARGVGGDPDIAVAEVYSIYVDPPAWSTGAGRKLMTAAIDFLTERAAREIRLWVFENNDRARRFYERAGFAADGSVETITVGAGTPHATLAREVRYTMHVR